MTENKITIKSVSELLNMKFFIPDYQRGYRWTTQQVKELLEDINEFASKKRKGPGEFYCLQPLVVRAMTTEEKIKYNLDPNESWNEVIDGQQRLTTIFLILKSLKEIIEVAGKPTEVYEIKYQRDANKKAGFLNSIETMGDKEYYTTVDYYHMTTAFLYIKKWFEENRECKLRFCETLLSYEIDDEDNSSKQTKDVANNVRFIWYESVNENPIKVFTRLNIGKISLTNAELIKALMLNRENFKKVDDFARRLRQQEIASEWDNIEYTLQKDDFWLFLHEKDYSHPTRIDFLFDILCYQNYLHLPQESLERIGSDEYRTFRYFTEYFKQKESNVDCCWSSVKSYFHTFMEWYDDLQLYHYVGFLIETSNYNNAGELLYKWSKERNKNTFVSYLKSEIKKIIDNCLETKDPNGNAKRKYKPVLLFHNIQTIINQNENKINNDKYKLGTFYKFPFHLYKLENWDVEHINSFTYNEENDMETQKEWLTNIFLGVSKSIQMLIQKYFEVKSDSEREDIFNEIKANVPQPERWEQEEKNSLWNYTLLDASTNRSYGNAIFSAKRRIIISKDRGIFIPIPKLSKDQKQFILEKEEKTTSSFVPPCTKHVFMKYYSPMTGDNNYWTKSPDAEAYIEDIMKCIEKLEE